MSSLREEYRPALLVLMAIAGAVLLIGCANVSNLLLGRAAVRHREMAIRIALGSGRGRLIRQLLTESLLLSFIGAGLGVLVAVWGTSLLVRFLDVSLDLTPDLRVLGFTAGVAILSGLLFGLAPAWCGAHADPMVALKAGDRGLVRGSGPSASKLLLIGQVALSMVLVAGVGLLLSTFCRLAWLDPGFEADRVLLTTSIFAATDTCRSAVPPCSGRFWKAFVNWRACVPQVSPTLRHAVRQTDPRTGNRRLRRLVTRGFGGVLQRSQ